MARAETGTSSAIGSNEARFPRYFFCFARTRSYGMWVDFLLDIELHKREREKKKRKILQSAMYFYFGFFWPKIPGDLDLNHSLWCVIFKLFPHISHVKFCAGNAYKCMIYCFSLNLFRALDFLSFFVYKREQRTGTKHRRHTPHWMFQTKETGNEYPSSFAWFSK